ncbi:MAG: cob(I)yrinic acid a,c-diamide adenosyltransferase [Pseudomonadota bacterium]
MIIIYTGNGKGKTSASVGQAIRAYGQGLSVGFCQFMKSDVQAGEQKILAELLGTTFHIGGCGFFRKEEDRPKHRAKALETLAWVHHQLANLDLIVLDESLYALRSGLLMREEIEALIDATEAIRQERSQQKSEENEGHKATCDGQIHLVFSGRDAPDWLIERAHTVSVIQEEKHAWKAGIKATRGIEF